MVTILGCIFGTFSSFPLYLFVFTLLIVRTLDCVSECVYVCVYSIVKSWLTHGQRSAGGSDACLLCTRTLNKLVTHCMSSGLLVSIHAFQHVWVQREHNSVRLNFCSQGLCVPQGIGTYTHTHTDDGSDSTATAGLCVQACPVCSQQHLQCMTVCVWGDVCGPSQFNRSTFYLYTT